MTAALENYQARMQRVLDHIDQHLDGDLDLDTTSGIAAFSKFHFHRQFAATFELSVHRYVQLARLKRAAERLTATDAPSVTEIALEAGYDARCLRPGLPAAGRPIAVVVPEIARLGGVAHGLRATRQSQEQVDADYL